MDIVLSLLSLFIAILALVLSYFAFRLHSPSPSLAPYLVWHDDPKNYDLKIFIVNESNVPIKVREVGATSAFRPIKGSSGIRKEIRESEGFEVFKEPLQIQARDSVELICKNIDPELAKELYSCDAYVWFIDSLRIEYQRTILNGRNNKRMNGTRKVRQVDTEWFLKDGATLTKLGPF